MTHPSADVGAPSGTVGASALVHRVLPGLGHSKYRLERSEARQLACMALMKVLRHYGLRGATETRVFDVLLLGPPNEILLLADTPAGNVFLHTNHRQESAVLCTRQYPRATVTEAFKNLAADHIAESQKHRTGSQKFANSGPGHSWRGPAGSGELGTLLDAWNASAAENRRVLDYTVLTSILDNVDETVQEVVRLKSAGFGYNEIGQMLGISKSRAHQHFKTFFDRVRGVWDSRR